jgi:hypothetical protein
MTVLSNSIINHIKGEAKKMHHGKIVIHINKENPHSDVEVITRERIMNDKEKEEQEEGKEPPKIIKKDEYKQG